MPFRLLGLTGMVAVIFYSSRNAALCVIRSTPFIIARSKGVPHRQLWLLFCTNYSVAPLEVLYMRHNVLTCQLDTFLSFQRGQVQALYSEAGGLAARRDAQLGVDRAQVGVHRVKADGQFGGYLVVRQPRDQQAQHFPLALGQVVWVRI